MSGLRLVFMGTPAFAVPCLDSLAAAGHEIAAVYSQPPRPAGRGHRERPGPVHAFALERGWPVRTPTSLKDQAACAAFRALAADAAVVVAYGLLLPAAVLQAPRLGCFNVHASLLPRWRGAAPIQRAILAGDAETGITIMAMDEGLDTGPIVLQQRLAVGTEETAGSLHDRLAAAGGPLMVRALEGLADGTIVSHPQTSEGVTYAAKISRDEARLDWSRPARALERRVRAFNPWPGAFTVLADERIKVLAAAVVADGGGAPPGTVLDDRLTVACGVDALRLRSVQRPGRAALPAEDLLRGFPVPAGTMLT
jgi:methionyl-tRNA formyltransferase